jgi:hypothetical protein
MLAKRIWFGAASRSWLVWLFVAGLLAPSCAKSTDVPSEDEQAGVGPSFAAGGARGLAGRANGGSTSIGSLNVSGESAGTLVVGRDDACATSSDAVAPLPPILQLVVDTSGSMDWPPGWAPATPDDSKPPGATKWEITSKALLAAVDSLPGEIALGASFFPNVSQENGTCLLDLIALPIGLLGGRASNARAAWAAAVGNVLTEGATPTHGAYRFGLGLLLTSKLPGNKFVLLITDGTPTCTLDCACTEDNLPVDSQPLIAEVAAALVSGVRTFVIGSPGSEDTRTVLSRISSEGGTAKPGCSDSGPNYCHFDMTTEEDLAGGLERALDQIALSLRPCEYPIPPPPAGQSLEPGLVNVLYTAPGGDTATIGRDPSASDCHEGWQYSADGTRIVLCGDACAQVMASVDATVEVLFGCQTIIAEPK